MKKLFAIIIISLLLSSCQTAIVRYQEKDITNNSNNDSDIYSGVEISDENKVLHTEYGLITFYADEFHGKQTANGEIFDMNKLSAAHIKFPLNTIIRVTNLENSKSVVVKVNDRMPMNEKGRILDVSKATAAKLGFIDSGVVKAKIEVLKWGDGKRVQTNKNISPSIRYK